MLNSCASGVSVVNIDNGFGAGYIANMINRYGFGITDVFTKETPLRMTKTYESEKPPTNLAEAMCRFLKSDEHKGFDYRNEDNWFVELT